MSIFPYINVNISSNQRGTKKGSFPKLGPQNVPLVTPKLSFLNGSRRGVKKITKNNSKLTFFEKRDPKVTQNRPLISTKIRPPKNPPQNHDHILYGYV